MYLILRQNIMAMCIIVFAFLNLTLAQAGNTSFSAAALGTQSYSCEDHADFKFIINQSTGRMVPCSWIDKPENLSGIAFDEQVEFRRNAQCYKDNKAVIRNACPKACGTCTLQPTSAPTTSPTKNPTWSPTKSPTKNPTWSPAKSPSNDGSPVDVCDVASIPNSNKLDVGFSVSGGGDINTKDIIVKMNEQLCFIGNSRKRIRGRRHLKEDEDNLEIKYIETKTFEKLDQGCQSNCVYDAKGTVTYTGNADDVNYVVVEAFIILKDTILPNEIQLVKEPSVPPITILDDDLSGPQGMNADIQPPQQNNKNNSSATKIWLPIVLVLLFSGIGIAFVLYSRRKTAMYKNANNTTMDSKDDMFFSVMEVVKSPSKVINDEKYKEEKEEDELFPIPTENLFDCGGACTNSQTI